MYETIKIERIGRVMLIRLDRPEQLNALNRKMTGEIITAVLDAERENEVAAIVLTGNGRAFAAGADISELLSMKAPEMIDQDIFSEWSQFTDCPIPKIAAVEGFALGGGCELMMMCDFAIAGDSARFGQPEVKIGVIAGMGGTQRMTRLIGPSRSMDLHLTGRMMDAPEALEAGLVARVVEAGQALKEALKAAQVIAGHSRAAVRAARSAVMQSQELSLQEGIVLERHVFHRLFGTADQREGMSAFLERREPRFGEVIRDTGL
jgi:enoyl-CoA hydratase